MHFVVDVGAVVLRSAYIGAVGFDPVNDANYALTHFLGIEIFGNGHLGLHDDIQTSLLDLGGHIVFQPKGMGILLMAVGKDAQPLKALGDHPVEERLKIFFGLPGVSHDKRRADRHSWHLGPHGIQEPIRFFHGRPSAHAFQNGVCNVLQGDVDVGTDFGVFANHVQDILRKSGGKEIVHRTLLAHGASLNATDEKGATALHHCASSGNRSLLDALLNGVGEQHVDSLQADRDGNVAADYAILAAMDLERERGAMSAEDESLTDSLYGIAAALESRAHQSHHLGKITHLGLHTERFDADNPSRWAVPNRGFQPKRINVYDDDVLSRDVLAFAKRILQAGEKRGYYAIWNSVPQAQNVVTASSQLTVTQTKGEGTIFTHIGDSGWPDSSKKWSRYGIATSKNAHKVARKKPLRVPYTRGDAIQMVGGVKCVSVYCVDVSRFEDSPEVERFKRTEIVGEIPLENPFAVLQSALSVIWNPVKPSSATIRATEWKPGSSFEFVDASKIWHSSKLMNLWRHIYYNLIRSKPSKSDSAQVFQAKKWCAAYIQSHCHLRDACKMQNVLSVVDDGRNIHDVIRVRAKISKGFIQSPSKKAGINERLSEIHGKKLDWVGQLAGRKTVRPFLVHLRPTEDPPYLVGGGSDGKQFAGLRNGYVWMDSPPPGVPELWDDAVGKTVFGKQYSRSDLYSMSTENRLKLLHFREGYYRADLATPATLDSRDALGISNDPRCTWGNRNMDLNMQVIGYEWLGDDDRWVVDGSLKDCRRQEQFLGETCRGRHMGAQGGTSMKTKGSVTSDARSNSMNNGGYMQRDEWSIRGRAHLQHGEWTVDPVDYVESSKKPTSILDHVQEGDRIELWMYVGVIDQMAEGTVQAVDLSVELGYKNSASVKEHPLDRAKSYDRSHVAEAMADVAERLGKRLCVPQSWAELLLDAYAWKPATAVRAWEENEAEACRAAGLPHRKLYRAQQVATEGQRFGLRQPTVVNAEHNDDGGDPVAPSEDASSFCQICYSDETADLRLKGLGCGHRFCEGCWRDHVDTQLLRNGLVDLRNGLRCPMRGSDGCNARIPMDVVDSVASDRAKALCHRIAIRNFVDDQPVLRWCPGTGCGAVVERMRRIGSSSAASEGRREKEHIINFNSAHCDKALHFFCFECGKVPHDPCSCEQFREWTEIVKQGTGIDPDSGVSDAEAMNMLSERWLTKNTRPCPKCKLSVLKADGCNHMTCQNPACKHQWCWICRRDWKVCGGTYNCKKQGIEGPTKNTDANVIIQKNLGEFAAASSEHLGRGCRFVSSWSSVCCYRVQSLTLHAYCICSDIFLINDAETTAWTETLHTTFHCRGLPEND